MCMLLLSEHRCQIKLFVVKLESPVEIHRHHHFLVLDIFGPIYQVKHTFETSLLLIKDYHFLKMLCPQHQSFFVFGASLHQFKAFILLNLPMSCAYFDRVMLLQT